MKHVGFRHAHFRVLALSATRAVTWPGSRTSSTTCGTISASRVCYGAFTPSTRVVSRSRGRGCSDRVEDRDAPRIGIAHVEVRTEDDPDVAKYTHHRLIEKIICEEGPVVKKGLEALQR